MRFKMQNLKCKILPRARAKPRARGFTPLENHARAPHKLRTRSLTGFTLIELIVSVGIFMIIMLMAIGSLAGMANADRKAQSIQTVVDNLNFALDDISRSIRTGTTYHCGTASEPSGEGSLSATNDCAANGSTYMAFRASGGNTIVYWFAPASSCGTAYSGGCIEESLDGGSSFLPLTSPNFYIDSMRFYVIGSCPLTSGSGCAADALQPKVTITLSAHIPLSANTNTTVRMQTSVTQRTYDQ